MRLYALWDAGCLVGVAPFFVDQWLGQHRLRFIGSGNVCTDYAQLICNADIRNEFVRQIVSDIVTNTAIGVVELEGMRQDTAEEFAISDVNEEFWRYDRELESTWVLPIPDHWEEFVSQTKKSLRRKIKKARKRLESKEVTVRSTSDGLEFDDAFAILVKLHQERFVGKGEPGVFSDPKFTDFLYNAAGSLVEKRRAEILIGFHDNGPIVSHLYLNAELGPQLYQSGVSAGAMQLEPGHLLFTYAVGKAIEGGFREFDFLRGSEPYKPYWGAIPQPITTARFVSNNLVPTTINRAYQFIRKLKNVCRPPIQHQKMST